MNRRGLGLSVLLAAAGCGEPEVRAWRGAVEVERVLEGAGCGEEEQLAEVEPPEPYLVVAVDTAGIDDVVTVYWCPEERDCGVPYEGGYLKQLTEDRFEAHLVVADPAFGLCTGRWAELIGEQTADGAVTVDTTGAAIDDVVDTIARIAHARVEAAR